MTMQLAIDAKRQVNAVNLSIPGYTCTIAISHRDLKAFLQHYHFDGKTLIKAKDQGVLRLRYELRRIGYADIRLGC